MRSSWPVRSQSCFDNHQTQQRTNQLVVQSFDLIVRHLRGCQLTKRGFGEAMYLALKIDIFNVFLQPLSVLDSLKRCQFL